MRWARALAARLAQTFRRGSSEARLDEEIRFHIEMETEKLVRAGVPPAEARRRALVAFGGVERHKEGVRGAWGLPGLDTTLRSLALTVRSLVRSPGFVLPAVATLALGIGADTALFSLVESILLRPLPYPQADRLVAIGHAAPALGSEAGQSSGTYLFYRERARSLEAVAGYYENQVNVGGDAEGDAERVAVAMVTPSLFEVLGVHPAIGQLFSSGEETGGDAPIEVLMGYDLWTRRFGSDPAIVGRTIRANEVPRLVVGVLPKGFAFPRRETQLWYEDAPRPSSADLDDFYWSSVARLARGATAQGARRELDALIPELEERWGRTAPAELRATVRPLRDQVVGDLRPALWALLGGMTFVLLIACANVANLFLVRAEHRGREVVVRIALGAGRGDILRFVLAESLVLAALGGAIGVAAAWGALHLLVAIGPESLPRVDEIGFDAASTTFAAAITATTGVVLGLVSAARHRRPDLVAGLREGRRGGMAGPARQRARDVLVAAQLALALTLLVGSALMAQSFWRLRGVDPGFDAADVLTFDIPLPYTTYPTDEASRAFWPRLLDGIRALPGVETAGAASLLPLVPLPPYYDRPVQSEGAVDDAGDVAPRATYSFVTDGWLDALRIRTTGARSERAWRETDVPVLLSSALARRLFGAADPVGRRIRRTQGGDRAWKTVVGVVGDVPRERVSGPAAEVVYVPVLDRSVDGEFQPGAMSIVIRASVPPTTLVPAVRAVVRELDPGLPLAHVRTMTRILDSSMANTSLTTVLLLVAALSALLLGGVGVYGVVSCAVGRRTHEIGVRVALGATRRDVRRLVARQGGAPVLVGVAIGVVAALGLTRSLKSLLYGVGATDPLTFAGVSLLLVAVAAAAGWLPTMRATRVDPMVALRAE